MQAEVFISYAREDRAAAERFAKAFEAAGLLVWWDAALRAGEPFDMRIEDAIRGAGVVVVLWSQHSVRSRWVRAEATLGDRLGRLLPVRIDACELPILFELTHTVDLSDWDGSASDARWAALVSQARAAIESRALAGEAQARAPSRADGSAPREEPRRSRTNIPSSLPALLGREREHAALLAAVEAHAVVTISGPGGVGKTRLAQAVAADCLDRFEDGVWWVELAPVSSAALVPDAIARATGLALRGDVQDLVDQLRDRSLLLVIDNCEHVVDAAASSIAAIAAMASHVRILATSQERLRLPVEHLFRLDPLSVATEAGAKTAGAVALFAARAKAVQPDFALSAETIPVVQQICRRLDGMPLAIELAAARLPILGLRGLRDRLDDRLRVLANAMRDAPARQRTLRAALEWSYALLTPSEKTLFDRLGVFVGGFDLAAAEGVCAGDTLEAWEVVELVGALLDKSLLATDGADPPRYRLLETPRAFAIEQLRASEHERAVRARHAALMRQRLLAAQDEQWTRKGAELVGRVIRDIDNLRAALTWAAGPHGDAEMLIALAGTGSIVWTRAGAEAEGLAWCETALAAVDERAQPALEAELLVAFGKLGHQSDAQREIPALERAADLFDKIGDRQGAFVALATLAKKHVWRRDLEAADRVIEAAEKRFDAGWPPPMRMPILQAKTYLLEIRGRAVDGEPLMREAVSLMQSMGDPDEIDLAKIELAESYMVQGKVKEAAALRREVYESGGRAGRGALNMANLAGAYAQTGELEEAVRLSRAAFSVLRNSHKLAAFVDHFALLCCKLGLSDHAARLIGRADAHVRSSGFEREVSEESARRLAHGHLSAALEPVVLEGLMAEGAQMRDADAVAAALDAMP